MLTFDDRRPSLPQSQDDLKDWAKEAWNKKAQMDNAEAVSKVLLHYTKRHEVLSARLDQVIGAGDPTHAAIIQVELRAIEKSISDLAKEK